MRQNNRYLLFILDTPRTKQISKTQKLSRKRIIEAENGNVCRAETPGLRVDEFVLGAMQPLMTLLGR